MDEEIAQNTLQSKKILMCVTEKFILGGIETYYMRMFRWAYKKGYTLILLLPQYTHVIDEWKKEISDLGIMVWFYSDDVFSVHIKDLSQTYMEIKSCHKTIVCNNPHTYIAAVCMSKRYKWENANILFYVLHPEMSRCSEKKILNIGYKNMMCTWLTKNGLIFMDEQTLDSFERYYHINLKYKPDILRLGQDIAEHCEIHPKNKDKFVILSICRMDFPFKGYVVGLLDAYAELKEKYPHIEMIIIGDGPNYNQLLVKLENLEAGKKADVHLVKRIPYEQIDTYIEQCDVYVGMGTTLLDAGKKGKIGILAAANQYRPISSGYFFENPTSVSAFYGEKNYNKYNIADLIEKIIQCNEKEYFTWCKQSYEAVRQEYNINLIMKKIATIKTKKIDKLSIHIVKAYDKIILSMKRKAGLR